MVAVPQEVLEAFECVGVPEKLPGGEGNSAIVGNLVFKPIDYVERYEWACDILCRIPQTGFRVSKSRKSILGKFTHAGWGATSFEPGELIRGRWKDKLEVCQDFQDVVQRVSISPMPPSDDRWTLAHEITWGELNFPLKVHPDILQKIESIFANYRNVDHTNQIIHSDLCGNILFDEVSAPLIIDFSPACRPTVYAQAILVADAIAWENAPVNLKDVLPETMYYNQMFLRAINFRIIVAALFYPFDVDKFEREYQNFLPLLQELV